VLFVLHLHKQHIPKRPDAQASQQKFIILAHAQIYTLYIPQSNYDKKIKISDRIQNFMTHQFNLGKRNPSSFNTR